MDALLDGVPVRHMKKMTPGRYESGETPASEAACEGCRCRNCAADCDMRPRKEDCSDVCIGHRYAVTSCTLFVPEESGRA
ncbi:MAG: hypothetical protein EOM54_10080 [Clostridia bacterium]|nr:hypothetical protein [Clostridia bacterium]